VLLKQWVCVLILSSVLIDRNCRVWVCQIILSCCTLERASEDELKLTSTETPDFLMRVDLRPNLIRAPNSDQLRCTVIGFSGMMQVLVWLKSQS